MAEECNHDCSSCGTTCGADTRPKDLHEAPHELSDIRHVIAVVSGKGGVGKSLVTGLLSVAMSRKGKRILLALPSRKCLASAARCGAVKREHTL